MSLSVRSLAEGVGGDHDFDRAREERALRLLPRLRSQAGVLDRGRPSAVREARGFFLCAPPRGRVHDGDARVASRPAERLLEHGVDLGLALARIVDFHRA